MIETKIDNIENNIIDAEEKLNNEQFMIMEAMKKVKDPFKSLTVEDIMKDLKVGQVTAYEIFKRDDFPAITVGKTKTVTTLAYLIWKMKQQEFTNLLLNIEVKNCKYKNVYLIQMYLGLRCGEALALDIHDIDLKNRKVNIHRTLTTDENNKIIMGNKTKTYAGKRVVSIPEFIIPHIMEQMKIAVAQDGNSEKLLFKPDDKTYTSRTNVNSELKRILKRKFNISDISTHSLRHTFGTRCIEFGMDAVVVQKLMGHRDIMVTLNTYTSVFDKYKASQIDKVNQYYLDKNIAMLEDISSKLLPENDDKVIE